MCVVSISNKKGDDLRDPQNNTTPKNDLILLKKDLVKMLKISC